MDKRKSITKINEFLKKVNNKFKVKKAVFFGSRAFGKAEKDSDIDLIIVSDDFKKMNFFDRVSSMYDYWDIDVPIDFLCYTEEEFDKLSKLVSIVSYALKKGIVISS